MGDSNRMSNTNIPEPQAATPEPAPPTLTADPPRPDSKQPPAPSTDVEEALLGLCVHCIHRQTCRRPRPEGGVWHCEDHE